MFYVSYDGAQEPLGYSQVLPYLRRLAREFAITLFSFEKSAPTAEFREKLARDGIDWRPLRYHGRPPVISTAADVLAGRRLLILAARSGAPAIVHVRSYVPALIALLARPQTGGRLLFDIRGFWADERVEGGLWPRGGALYRLAKRCERWFFREADAVVTLTEASVPQIEAWTAERRVPIEVIPTCAQTERFSDRPVRPGAPNVVWAGSVGTWYRFDLASRVAAALAMPLTVLTHQTAEARRILGAADATVGSVPPDELPQALFAGDVGLCLYRESFSRIASAPTRFAEYLAAGMPVLVTPGVGDLEALVERHHVGVVLRGEDSRAIETAAARMRGLVDDQAVVERCRRLARERFDVESGSASYARLYRGLLARDATPTSAPELRRGRRPLL